ncbi:hypothetical protein HID58_041465 [Brassica napus]|uniref:Uncharacterized protein n=1 Tax=Brassica napus TaxID=3708 RepID=A0ABQ8BAX1_BRANA|nr:hypothetical protein HID58_041465 [Brassica napus]
MYGQAMEKATMTLENHRQEVNLWVWEMKQVMQKMAHMKRTFLEETLANDWWACTKVMPRGVRETSEDALVALQDDTHNQVVAQSVMLRIETYVLEDDSD